MATFCVNTNSANFQNLVNEYNIDPLSLEVTIFQWMRDNDKVWSEENNNELRDYIENEYSINKVFNVESKEMFDAYSKLYDAVSQTGSMSKEDALDLYSKVSQVVGDSNASLYMDNEGNWHVNMKMPSYEGMTSEMQSIKEKAIADGTFMKAPNGNPTNLNERQWLQVRTKNFINWFGDWINDPASASKVVDENGEPLQVYHHTDNSNLTEFSTDFENYFAKDGGTKEAIFFDENKTGTLGRRYDIPVFLNIRELNEYNETKQQLHDRGTTYREVVNQSAKNNNKNGGVHMKDFDDNKMEHQSIWIVHNPNQIKSATDNVGTFSAESDDIRYNQEMSELFDVIDYISRKEKFVMPVEDGQTQNYELLSKYHKRYYLPKTFGTEEQIQDKLETYLVAHDLPRDTVAFERTRSGRLVAYFNDEVIKDSIERNEANAEIGDLFSTPEETQSVTTVLNKLSTITGLKYKTITESEANELVKGKDFSSTNAFVYNDTCYFIQGRKLNTDIAAEEMLHPFIAAVRKYNPKAFDSLLRDARRAFPKLRLEIAKAYENNHIIRDEELVTQALSRAFRKDIKDNPEGHKLKNLIKHFIDYVRDVFRSFVNINGRTTQYFTNIDNILQNKEVKAEDLASNIKIEELAKVINSDIEKLESDTEVFRQNIEGVQQTNIPAAETNVSVTESTGGYQQRTRENADWSDITLALAVDFTTRGETLTAQQAGSKDFGYLGNREPRQDVKDKYIAAYPTGDLSTIVEELYNQIISKGLPTKNIKLNIAGNGIYSLVTNEIDSPFLSQNDVNNTVTSIIKLLQERKGITISEIRSGGQTGIDEAGIIAAQRLGIPASVHAPKGFAFRNANGKDIYSKEQFLERFNQQPQQQPAFEQQEEKIKKEIKQQDEVTEEIQEAVEETEAIPVTRKVINPLKQEFDNLRARGKEFPLEERRHVAKVVVNYVSSIIDNIKKYGVDYVNQIFSDSSIDAETVFAGKNLNFKDIDFQSMSRKDIISKVGLMNIITYVKEKYINPDLREIEDERIEENLRTAYENFNAILMMANKDLVLCEGYTVETGYKNVTYNDETNEIQGDFQTDQQELGETEAWNLRERSVSAKNSMSQVIRRMIRRTPVYKNGEPQTDDYGYGFDLYCNPDTLMNTLLDKCSKCSTMTQMRSVLRQNKVAFPEFEGILKTLDGNKEFADKFFSNFCKDQTTFAIAAKMPNQSKNGNVEFGMRVLNAHTYKDDFDSAIVEKKYFGEWQLWPDTDGNIKNTLDKAVENSKRLVEISESLRKTDDNTQKAALLKEGLAIAGVDATVSDDAIAGIINDKSSLNTIATAFKSLNTKLSGALKTYNSLSNKKDFGSYNPIAYKGNQLGQPLEQLANAIQDFVPLTIEPSAYENGKSYYAYNNPSFIGVLKRKIKDDEQFEKLCKEEFKMSKFFFDTNSGLWYNDWLRLMQDENKRKLFDHSVVLGFNGENYIDMGVSAFEATCILNYFASPEDNFAWYKVPIPSDKNSFEFIKFVKLKYQKDSDLYDSNPFLESFRNNVSQEIMRINTVLQRSFNKNFANVDYFDIKKNTFEGSFENLTIDDYIEHLDSLENTGAVFTFFPFLTDEIRNKTVLGKQIFKKIKGEELDDDAAYSKNILTAIDSYMRKLEDAEIQNFRKHGLFEYETIRKKDPIGGSYNAVQNRFLSKLHDSYGQVANSLRKGNNLLEGLTAGAIINDQNEDNIIENLTEYQKNELLRRDILIQDGNTLAINHNKAPYGESLYNAIIADEMSNQIEDKIREYVWGNYYGRLNIIQLTVTDPAYFGDIINFQKRFAMTHSPGIRMNTEAQINGESVTDGYGRSMTLPDNIVSSETVKNEVVKIFQKQAEKTQGAEKEFYSQCAKDAKDVFSKINQTDAQAYTCPTAMRKKLAMIGEWGDAQEDAYQQIRKGDNSFELAKEILKVTKPFVGGTTVAYSGGAMVNMRNPIQHKNSEYMLLLANALAESQGEKTILGEIYRFMESTHWDGENYKRNGIDTIQFKSAVKVGGTALTDIQDLPVENIEKALNIYAFNDNGEYNPAYVTKYNYEYYSFQQEVPNHFQDHEQLIGSQQRILAVADQNPDYELEINGKTIAARDAIKKYFDLHAKNIYASQNELLAELLIDNAAFTDDLNRLAKKVKGETLEEKTKAFTRILKNNYKLPESLTASITDRFIANNGESFKNGDIAISNADKKYVLSKLLQDSISNDAKFDSDILVGCQLDDVTGDFIIPLSDPIQSSKIQQLLFSLVKNRINKQKISGGPAVQVSSYGISENLETKFKTDNKGNRVIDHMEVYVTCPTAELEAKLMKKDKDGNYIRMYTVEEALRKHLLTDDDLKMIGYRIPTEDTYSIIPLKIKGFLPRFAGDAIMLPADHVAITGSDFDIDKFYLIRKGNAYNSRQRRNNDIFDIEYAMLQTPESTEKMFNAGNFDTLKKLSRNIASKKGFDNIQYNIMTQSADSYFYEQNTAAKKLIGIMANGTTSHAFLALQNIHVKFNMPFSYKGREITELKLDPERNFEGKPVSKVLGSTVGAAADAAKEPVFKNLNITPATAGVAEFLWRTGFPESFVAYFLAQPILVDCVNEYTMRSSYENVSLRTVIKDKITEKTGNFTNATIEKAAKIELSRRDFSEEEFERNLNYHTLDIPALYLMYSLLDSAHDLNELTFMTKFNSMTNAAGPTISEMLATERRIHKFIDTYDTFITEGEGIDLPEDVIKNNSMLKAFYETTVGTAGDIVTDQLENGSVYKIFQPYFQHYSPAFKSVLEVFDRTTKTSADADTIEDLFKFFMLYNATISHTYNNKVVPPVIDGSKEARKKYASSNFVKKVIDNKNNTDTTNDFLKLYHITEKTSRIPIDTVDTDVNGGSSDFNEQIRGTWTDMLSNEKTGSLAMELMKYSIYRSGFKYSPKTPLHLSTVDLKLALEGYTDMLNATIMENISPEEVANVIEQFKRNNSNNPNIVPVIYKSAFKNSGFTEKNDMLIITDSDKNLLSLASYSDDNETVFTSMIKYKDNLYKLVKKTGTADSRSLTYKKVGKLGIKSNFVEVNGNDNYITSIFENFTEDEDIVEASDSKEQMPDVSEENNTNKSNLPDYSDVTLNEEESSEQNNISNKVNDFKQNECK